MKQRTLWGCNVSCICKILSEGRLWAGIRKQSKECCGIITCHQPPRFVKGTCFGTVQMLFKDIRLLFFVKVFCFFQCVCFLRLFFGFVPVAFSKESQNIVVVIFCLFFLVF